MSFEGEMPNLEKMKITDAEAVAVLIKEGVDSPVFQKFLDEGEEEANRKNTGAANLEWDLRRLKVYHRAGKNREYEAEDLAVLRCAAASDGNEGLVKQLDKIIAEGWPDE